MAKTDSPRDLGASFRQLFEVLPAISDSLRNAVYRVRHEVYCEQLKYEPERADRMESDEYDAHSLHCLMRTATEPKELVGCARLILPDPNNPARLLPFERTCEHVLDRSIIDPSRLPRESIAEVSRLAVSSQFRRRKGELTESVPMDFGSSSQPRFPFIPVGLYLALVALCNRNGIDTVFLITEPRLLDHFVKIGFIIKQIGGPIEHRGTRVPSMIDVIALVKEMRSLIKPLYREISSQVDRAYENQLAVN